MPDVRSSRGNLQTSTTCRDHSETCRRYSPMNQMEDKQFHEKYFHMPLIEKRSSRLLRPTDRELTFDQRGNEESKTCVEFGEFRLLPEVSNLIANLQGGENTRSFIHSFFRLPEISNIIQSFINGRVVGLLNFTTHR